jgi:hypothetical protein
MLQNLKIAQKKYWIEVLLQKLAAAKSCIAKIGSIYIMYYNNSAAIYTSTNNSHTK